jgi:hypothetical protein
MKKTSFVFSFFLFSIFNTGCTPVPIPHVPDDTPSCAAACVKLDKDHLNCEEGKPLDDGTTCQKFCENTQNSGHALRPSCILSDQVKTCDDIQKCFQK